MDLSNFFYELDESFIAQEPLINRDESKLLVLNRFSEEILHLHFSQILNFVKKGDCLVLNNTRVLKARLFAVNSCTNARLEFLLVKCLEHNVWQVLCRPAKRAKIGNYFKFSNGMKAKILDDLGEGMKLVEFVNFGNDFFEVLDEIGQIPLPPYIKNNSDRNFSNYQTIYSKILGSIAAPTAGLHFTGNVLNNLKQKGVSICFVTLHVGLGTFKPVKVKNIKNHKMHYENYFILKEAADVINKTKKLGGRVFCVGTTSCRTLESVFLKHGKICADSGSTNLFIYPGFKFNVMDALITNFHLPCSTLLMLVSAFAGRGKILKAYEQAKLKNYRFFSFGDAMLIV